MSKALLGKGSADIHHSTVEEGELALPLGTNREKTYKDAVFFFFFFNLQMVHLVPLTIKWLE